MPAPNGGGGNAGSGSGGAVVTIAIPPQPVTSSAKKPAYVSPNTASIGIVVTPQGGTAYPAVIANVPGTSCTPASGGGYTCIIDVTATYGVDLVTITAYSAANGGGSVLSSGSLTSTFSASASPSPALNVVLTGVVKNIGLTIVHGTVMDSYVPVGQSATLNVVGKDASGAVIVGTYDAPITVALPGGSGLTLGTTSFADSTHTTSTIAYIGGPTYYTTPTSALTITATAGGGAITQGIAFNPTSTVLQFAAGDGSANSTFPLNMVNYGSKLVYALQGDTDGELVSLDPTTGASTVIPALGYEPVSVYVDPKFNGIWLPSSDESGNDNLNCYSSPTAGDVPISVATPGGSEPQHLALDGQNNLWFTAQYSLIGRVVVTGQCATDGGDPTYSNAPEQENDTEFSAIVPDATAAKVWISDFDNPVFYSAIPSPPPMLVSPFDLSEDAYGINSMTGDSSGNIIAAVDADPNSYVSIKPSGSGSFSTVVPLPPYSGPALIATTSAAVGVARTQFSGAPAAGTIAYSDTDLDGVGIFAASDPGNLALLGLPNANTSDGCQGLAFDGAGALWTVCLKSSGGLASAVYRVVLTGAWNTFVSTTSIPQEESVDMGIGGGAATTTFTVGCTGDVTCAFVSGFPREIAVTASDSATGPGTVTATGSDGHSVATVFNVTPRITGTQPNPAIARHMAGRHRRIP